MFEGNFAEGTQDLAILEDLEGVVSVRSFEALIQWLYLRKINSIPKNQKIESRLQ